MPKFADKGFITPETSPTQIEPWSNVIDYCSYRTEGVIGLGRVSVLQTPHTDHYPILAEWDLLTPQPNAE